MFLFMATSAAHAQAAGEQVTPPEKIAAHAELHIPRLTQAPALEDFLSMEPKGEVAQQMTRVTDFRQRNPHDGDPVTQPTAAYLGYDQKNLYVVFVCHDDPKKVRGRMSRREDVYDDDQVEIMLDTFHDQRRAYAFLSTPLGIQWDAIWNEATRGETNNGNWDQSWDAVWNSRGKLTEQGYVVWMSIPFKSLRFPAGDKQEWGVILYREITRNTEDTFWPYVTYKVAGRLRQAATLKGLEGISPGRDIELIPYGIMRGFRALDQRDPSNPYFQHAVAQGQTGLDAKFVFHDHFTLDATVNPDFSQVESEDPQITVNQRFAVYFPEKRPFFLENEDFFRTPIDLFFTRNIADPSAGLRLTGKQNGYSVGLMTTDDRSPGLIVPDSDPLSGSRSYYTIARVSRDILNQSSVGLLYTDWEYPQAKQFNRIGGVDARFRLGPTWSLEGQAVVSSTNLGTYQAGPADQIELRRDGLHFSYDNIYSDISPGFTTVPGFVNRTDIRSMAQTIDYRFRPKKGWIVDWGPSINQSLVYDHEGTRLDTDYYPYLAIHGRGQTYVFLNPYEEKRERLRPQDFAAIGLSGVTADFDYHERYTGASFQTSYLKWATISAGYTYGDGVNFVPAAKLPKHFNLPPQYLTARVTRATGGLTIRPIKPLKIDNTYLYERLRASDAAYQFMKATRAGQGILGNHIFRSKWNWQFTPRLSMRLILQYYAVLANTPGNTVYPYTYLPTQKQFNTDFLITYLVHPGTAVYVGYNSDLQNYDHGLALDPLAGLYSNRGYINDSRQFFVKVAYQFRY